MRQFNVPTIGERLMRAVMGREVGVVGTVIWVFSVPVLVGVVLLIVGAIQRRKYH
jgi:ABC-type dipeptide/oligopeptide/nickel transport system permease component